MMKTKYTIYRLLFFCGIATTVFSCKEDLGNYTYSPIDTLNINEVDGSYVVQLGLSPEIYPDLKFTLKEDVSDDDFTYEWILYSGRDRHVVSTDKNLTTALPFPVGTYPLYFVVKEKSTGVTWSKNMRVTVEGAFGMYGWFVLSDVEGSARLDYYQDDNTNWHSYPASRLVRGVTDFIFDGETPFPLSGKPISLVSYNDGPTSTNRQRFLYINTTAVTGKLNVQQSLAWLPNHPTLNYLFSKESSVGQLSRADYIHPTSINWSAFAVEGNNLYRRAGQNGRYGVPINRLNGKSLFNFSPYIVMPPASSDMLALLYDTNAKRFTKAGNKDYVDPLTTPDAAFDLGNIGKDLIWGGYTSDFGGQAVYLFRDNGRHYIARIAINSSLSSITPISMTDVTDVLTGIAQATHFTLGQQYGYLFYASGNKLYRYNMDSAPGTKPDEVFDLGDKKVSMLKYQRLLSSYIGTTSFNNAIERYAPVGYSIILGTYDESNPRTSGEVHFLKSPQFSGMLTEYPFSPFQGLGIPVDVSYNEL